MQMSFIGCIVNARDIFGTGPTQGPLVSSIRKYKYPKVRISLETENGGHVTANSCWAFIFNVPRYAMNLPIAADANPEDGALDLCTFRGWQFISRAILSVGRVVAAAQKLDEQ